MNLFTISHQLYPTNLNPLRIQTPLGDLFFNCEIFDTSLMTIQPTKIESFQSKNIISSWIFEDFIVEFIRLNFAPKLPLGMKIENCILGAWRIKSLKKMVRCDFTCCLENDLEGFPEPGEGLIADSFENEYYKLSIGTEDEEYLQNRAASQFWLPEHFKTKIRADQIVYLHNGIRIKLPELSQTEKSQIHFIVSWSLKENSDISTWYAVDQSSKEILEQAGIK